ncbi:hypothetical protein [Fusibacter ferrireducens]|uniref:Uncharacterized protein n=1 Tax=Fusibacter ferrireducens TaxID=2785058 RepID=A0ABR9ZN82_9FIRM|nr:hypothetical protein [Fusibacter ferrireducens]MBF4691930.1 hypothetical protein [Fusibacter ferrireducens]
MTDKNYNKFIQMGLIALIALITIFIYMAFQLGEVKRHSRDTYQTVNELYYKLDTLSTQMDRFEKKNQRIKDTSYSINFIELDQMSLANVKFTAELSQTATDQEITLLYRSSNLSDQDQNEHSTEWLKMPLIHHYNQIESEIALPYANDYEVQLMFESDGVAFYEPLPNLEIHSTLEHMFARAIHLHKIKGNKVEFDAQIVNFKSQYDVKLNTALCHIYYEDQIQKTYDVMQVTQEGTQKEPQLQMANQGQDFWFVNTSYTFENIQDFDPQKVRIELILTDSLGNEYKTRSGL